MTGFYTNREMHGRVKVKTSAQKEAEREAKKKLLVKKFSAAKDRLFELKNKFENVCKVEYLY